MRMITGLALAALVPLMPFSSAASHARTKEPTAISAEALAMKARASGARDVSTRPAPDGGVTIDGKLGGASFALSFPKGWNGDALVFAHGYSTPGTPVAVSADPITSGPGGGMMRFAYQDGLAAGHSAYDKDGLGVETGTVNTKRLRDLLVRMGARRVYAGGDSMGGGIVVALLEKYPRAFAGGLARCGVVDSWKSLLGQLYDMRGAYNFLTAGTPYALPGTQDIRRSALSPLPPAGDKADPVAYGWNQLVRIATPVLALYAAAGKNPQGREARIARQVGAIGGFEVDPGSLAFPLVTVGLGAGDLAATAGGVPYGNVGKLYASDTMTSEEAARLNAGIQRVAASPRALAYLTRWYEATGRISAPLVTMHNTIDSLVPYAQEKAFEAKVRNAGRTRYLAAYGVPPLRAPLPVGGVEAYTHCGFTPEQTHAAWNALRNWSITGERPAPDAVK